MSLVYTFTIAERTVVFFLMVWMATVVWRASRRDGPMLRAFALFFTANAWVLGWYLVAFLFRLTGHTELQRVFWEHAWIAWTPLLVSLLYLYRTLR